MKKLMLRGIVVGPVQTNCYFLKNEETQEILIVDPGRSRKELFMLWINYRENLWGFY